MNRRKVLKTLALIPMASFFPSDLKAERARLKRIGVQLFSLPKMLETNFRGGIEMLAAMGYREVELYGPYPFSAPAAHERWKAVTPNLGFSGSGFFGMGVDEVKSIFKANKIAIPSIHTDLVTLETRMEQLGEASDTLGFKYVGLPAIPEERRTTLDDYKKMADAFNKIGESAKREGLKFAYHNHGYGLQEMEGQIPLNLIMERTDPGLVFFEMDIFWTTAGGADPGEYLKAYPGRYHLMHVKDMKEERQFSGDGGNPRQWIELFPYMTTAGMGALDLKTIIETARKSGVKHFFVEQDMVDQPEIALKQSFDYLKSI